MSRNRCSWQQLSVQWRVALRIGKAAYNRLSKEDRSRMRLTAFVETLQTGVTPPWARISYLAWQNPDAEHDPGALQERTEILEALPTLNKAQWLYYRVLSELEALGGSLTPGKPKKARKRRAGKPASRRPKSKGKARSKTKAMAHVRRATRRTRRKV
jgi:hypothetical protein